MPVLTTTEIMDLIPNRYPIIYMDYVEEMVPDESIVAVKNVTINEQFFQGHFPGNPVMPGVLIIESLAQAASILILSSPQFKGKTAYMTGINNAKFKKMVVPGDVLKLHATFGKVRENMGTVTVTAKVNDKVATSAELMFVVAPDEQN
ncbi:3-hydroxyacyl-ACP dehydratase FabZ [Fructobacillus evanidus]|uniref:3-hydroxyacyl-[acyl-carrier-protein] dehydratase FabZ n=1 Tax=Fructobacillus evanidus TaxID=3064281 RepID=A0ABM9MSF3_9LACO|nr:3-hydroxymyristoyl/3-hydroxydecanoyl-(acyl carrier protein) dehydratase (FabA) [Fructobacillus sp. LMG 32999]CAK1233753.1 3-hydroxymyristoyl/3-hydroxydecanoyl-(acyl carrier protein) dehydratase (FabA) [Fructobacillus sp. LMG 32999]CAK1236490.1 3-hydroxymyristoyl/3-hydroxydecanoyl-(acyl carrier protein) dehydratase (FabA) [Fructobacillus sp. LMG 32999]CAK1236826.1 3-hydroxymyristoyl/3-hydroxydecanoyl-(acyl carrier protein) dehydratase (FabA) [Fructobacillus sp. LMG 32999]CAK1237273.1 3-hydrox